jgi:divalent metal cation (Fe/Co/Zn/Cd) transporter
VEALHLVERPLSAHDGDWLRLARRAKLLAWASLAWLTLEGAVGVIAGLVAGSIALIGFGLDSAIEGIASVIVVWRFTGSRTLSHHAERRAQQFVGISFFLLAPYIAVEALRTLIIEHHPETSVIGIVLTTGTLLICPRLGLAKQRLGDRLGSAATKGEGKQNLLCAGLAIGVLAGLVANTAPGVWWLDPIVALAIAVIAVREGRASYPATAARTAADHASRKVTSRAGVSDHSPRRQRR